MSRTPDIDTPEDGLQKEAKLDDVMLAMDVVDTLRHERNLIARDLAEDDRREDLIKRLRGIYSAQGITVPDSILMDGVKALEEERFAFTPAKPGLGRSLARIYISRKKWLPLLYTLIFICGAAWTINHYGFVRPAQIEAERQEQLAIEAEQRAEADAAERERQLTQVLPTQLETQRKAAIKAAKTSEMKARAQALFVQGETAIAEEDIEAAKTTIDAMKTFRQDLSQAYKVRVVSRPGEYSGVFRINDDGGIEVRNYYLIVEGINAAGNPVTVDITSEEDQKTKRVNIWGVRVPEAVFNRVAADKRDDQIIQNSIIGTKNSGVLKPDYTVDASGGFILDW